MWSDGSFAPFYCAPTNGVTWSLWILPRPIEDSHPYIHFGELAQLRENVNWKELVGYQNKLPCENRCVFWKAFSVRSLYAPAGGGWGANKPTTRERLRKRCQGFPIVPWGRGSPWAENQVFDLVFFASLFCSSYLFREVLRYSYF